MYIIGIDIASKKSAFTILNENQEVVKFCDIKMKPINKYENDIEYFNDLKAKLEKELLVYDFLKENSIIVIEHNVRHQTLSKSIGMWIACLCALKPLNLTYKQPSKWYNDLKLGKSNDKREIRKQKAKDFFYQNNKHLEVEISISEDVADSYCIAKSWFVV